MDIISTEDLLMIINQLQNDSTTLQGDLNKEIEEREKEIQEQIKDAIKSYINFYLKSNSDAQSSFGLNLDTEDEINKITMSITITLTPKSEETPPTEEPEETPPTEVPGSEEE